MSKLGDFQNANYSYKTRSNPRNFRKLDIPDGQAVTIEIIDPQTNHEKGKFGDNLEELRRKHNIAELDIDVDAIFGDVRDKSPAREVNL